MATRIGTSSMTITLLAACTVDLWNDVAKTSSTDTIVRNREMHLLIPVSLDGAQFWKLKSRHQTSPLLASIVWRMEMQSCNLSRGPRWPAATLTILRQVACRHTGDRKRVPILQAISARRNPNAVQFPCRRHQQARPSRCHVPKRTCGFKANVASRQPLMNSLTFTGLSFKVISVSAGHGPR
ncbi:hypothetical protein E2P81_ATG08807 [Venturia nashicola]|nr:hypothetical protein E2P81_ATG08807 [Venturia nashicola]